MLFRKHKQPRLDYDAARQIPAIRKSICTAEMTAGFRDRETGHFEDVMLIEGEEGIREFMSLCGITERPEIFY